MPRLADFDLKPVANLEALVGFRRVVEGVRLSDAIVDYVVDLVRATRDRPTLLFGASPRSANMLAAAARASAALQGRDYVIPDDVKRLATPVLRHRVVLAPGTELEGTTAETVIDQVIGQVPAPR
jgi:MoxR-like ATPase